MEDVVAYEVHVQDFTDLLRRYRILLPAAISMLIKVLVMLEGTADKERADFSDGQRSPL